MSRRLDLELAMESIDPPVLRARRIRGTARARGELPGPRPAPARPRRYERRRPDEVLDQRCRTRARARRGKPPPRASARGRPQRAPRADGERIKTVRGLGVRVGWSVREAGVARSRPFFSAECDSQGCVGTHRGYAQRLVLGPQMREEN